MTLWLPLLIVNVAGYLWAFRRIAGQFAWYRLAEEKERRPLATKTKTRPDGAQWCGAIACAACFSCVWPLALILAYGISASHRGGRSVLYTPPEVKERVLQDRIRALEREAGIK